MLIPAFMISEPRWAFEIGFLISLPFKLIFFALVDGWYLVVGSLVESFTGA